VLVNRGLLKSGITIQTLEKNIFLNGIKHTYCY
jgi:hypothetical protein